MNRAKKITIILLLLIILCGTLFMAFNNTALSAKADEVKYYSPEQYTSSDYLLDENGNQTNKTIIQFANDVNYADMAAYIPELPQVVPRQFLEGGDGTYYYFGKEYGYYMVVEQEYIDLLLVDVDYQLDDGKIYDSNNEDNVYTMRVTPILQQSFYRRADKNGSMLYQTYPNYNRPVYYIANPRFTTSIANENTLNYGDEGYSKNTDKGLIIQQTKVDYREVSKFTGVDMWEKIGNFLA